MSSRGPRAEPRCEMPRPLGSRAGWSRLPHAARVLPGDSFASSVDSSRLPSRRRERAPSWSGPAGRRSRSPREGTRPRVQEADQDRDEGLALRERRGGRGRQLVSVRLHALSSRADRSRQNDSRGACILSISAPRREIETARRGPPRGARSVSPATSGGGGRGDDSRPTQAQTSLGSPQARQLSMAPVRSLTPTHS